MELGESVLCHLRPKRDRKGRETYLFCVLKIENEDRPDLGIDLLQYEGKAILCDVHVPAPDFDQVPDLQQFLHPETEPHAVVGKSNARTPYHVAEYTLPLSPGEVIQLCYRDSISSFDVTRNAERVVMASSRQSQSQGRRERVGEAAGSCFAWFRSRGQDVHSFQPADRIVALSGKPPVRTEKFIVPAAKSLLNNYRIPPGRTQASRSETGKGRLI